MIANGESLFGKVRSEELAPIERLIRRVTIQGAFYELLPEGETEKARLDRGQQRQEAA
jgi:hypothetical protein